MTLGYTLLVFLLILDVIEFLIGQQSWATVFFKGSNFLILDENFSINPDKSLVIFYNSVYKKRKLFEEIREDNFL